LWISNGNRIRKYNNKLRMLKMWYLEKIKENKIVNLYKKINILLKCIQNIQILDKDTIGIVLNKNIVLYNDMNFINITKGYNVMMGKQVHMNPKISLKEFYSNPSNIQKQIDESVKNQIEEIKVCNH